jgi:lipoprotein NlpD
MPRSLSTFPAPARPSPFQSDTRQRRVACIALALLGIALGGCASKPAAPPSPPETGKAAASSPRTAQATNGAATNKPRRAAPSAPRGEAVAKADRTFGKPARGAIIQGFDGRGSKGIDFAGAKGDPVFAARDGKVVYAGDGLRGYGRLILIKHDAIFLTAYAHNSELLVKNGATVKRGQVIARMGSTETDRVKLHFELRRDGNAVNPVPYFVPDDAAPGAEP